MQPEASERREGAVLIVEDDRPTREMLAAILSAERIPFHVSSTGHEAMEHAREHPPLVVVLDMHLPNLQGEAVGTALRIEFGQVLPILTMSASNETAAAERLGAYGYLQKPFELDQFLRLVRQGLDLARYDDQQRPGSTMRVPRAGHYPSESAALSPGAPAG